MSIRGRKGKINMHAQTRIRHRLIHGLHLVAALVMAVGGLLVPAPVRAQQTATMTITGPTTAPVDGVLSVAIYVKTATPVNAVQVDVKFPTDLLEYQSVNNTGSGFDADLISNAANGLLSLVRIKIDGGSGDMLVSTVNFKTLKNGKANLQMLNSSMATDAQTSENIVNVRQGLTIQIGDPALNPPDTTGGTGTSNGGTTPPTTDTNGDGVINEQDEPDPSVSPTPTPDPSATPTPKGSGLTGKSQTTTTGSSSGISAATWAVAGGSLLLIVASVLFSMRLLNRRSRRLASYQGYSGMQAPINQTYGQPGGYPAYQAPQYPGTTTYTPSQAPSAYQYPSQGQPTQSYQPTNPPQNYGNYQ